MCDLCLTDVFPVAVNLPINPVDVDRSTATSVDRNLPTIFIFTRWKLIGSAHPGAEWLCNFEWGVEGKKWSQTGTYTATTYRCLLTESPLVRLNCCAADKPSANGRGNDHSAPTTINIQFSGGSGKAQQFPFDSDMSGAKIWQKTSHSSAKLSWQLFGPLTFATHTWLTRLDNSISQFGPLL